MSFTFLMAQTRNRTSQWFSRLGHTSRQYTPLIQAEFTESDLYSQANSLFKAGYREAGIMIGFTAIRRNLKRILESCSHTYRNDLPEKTSSSRQYAIYELAYFFFGKGIIDIKLRRELSNFGKKASRAASGVKMSQGKGEKLLASINAFRPQLDEAMGRVLLTLPPHRRVIKSETPEVVSAETVVRLTRELSRVLDSWYMRVSGKAEFAITDPLVLLDKLRNRMLVSKKQYKIGRRLFNCPETLGTAEVRRLKALLAVAQECVSAERRWLTDPEKLMIGSMVGRGNSLEEIHERFGIVATDLKPAIEPATPTKPRDARQVEHWVGSGSKGGIPCQS